MPRKSLDIPDDLTEFIEERRDDVKPRGHFAPTAVQMLYYAKAKMEEEAKGEKKG